MKRNQVNEINDIKSRVEFNSRHEFSTRLSHIEAAFNGQAIGEHHPELLKYIPIATVACFESFFRSVIAELIDFGKPYTDNVVKFNQSKNVKFDFDIVNAIRSDTVTIGEFISHALSCNNYEDINSNISTLAGIDFTKSIKEFEPKSHVEEVNINALTFKQHFNQVVADIKRTFELRHIFCHEFATNVSIDPREIQRYFFHAKVFLNQVNEFIWHLLYPNAPQTQVAMNAEAMDKFQNMEAQLNDLIARIHEVAKHATDMWRIDSDLFDKSIEAWKLYRTAKAEASASVVHGGSMYGMVYGGSMTNTTREKVDSLQKEYQFVFKKYGC